MAEGVHTRLGLADVPLDFWREPARRAARRLPPDVMTVLEAEIIPRLRLAHQDDLRRTPACTDDRPPPTREEISQLARIAVRHDLSAALAFVETLCRQGLSLEVVLLELVAGAARLLGQEWKEDFRSFTEVSAGLGTLQQLVHIFGPSFAPAVPDRGLVVLMPAPREQHTLGMFLVGEFLRRAGWGVHIDPAMSQSDLQELLESRNVVMLGISLSTSALGGGVPRLVARARRVSRNPRLAVVIGGSADLRSLASDCGATLATSNPRDAVLFLENRLTTPS